MVHVLCCLKKHLGALYLCSYDSCTILWISKSGFGLARGHCVVFLVKTLYSHSASLHPAWCINGYQPVARQWGLMIALLTLPLQLLELTCVCNLTIFS